MQDHSPQIAGIDCRIVDVYVLVHCHSQLKVIAEILLLTQSNYDFTTLLATPG
jgi:hypothetical protein